MSGEKKQQHTRRIEVFRPGTFRTMNGRTVTYSAGDVAALAESYDPEITPAPVVVGHPKTDSPADSWVKRPRRKEIASPSGTFSSFGCCFDGPKHSGRGWKTPSGK